MKVNSFGLSTTKIKMKNGQKLLAKTTLAVALALIMSLASVLPLFGGALVGGAQAAPITSPSSGAELFAVGSNFEGRTGLDTVAGNTTALTRVGTALGWTQVSVGNNHSLAINENGELFAFGSNTGGRTGLDTAVGTTTTPTRVGTESNWTQASVGSAHSLAINENGELFTFGSNANGATGLNTLVGDTTTPTRVGTASNWTQVSAGGLHSLAVNASGELFAWGSNGSGVTGLGLGAGITLVPTRVGTASNWTQVSAGSTHSLAINASGELFAFGLNTNARTGLDVTFGSTTTPTRVGTESNWTQISAGSTHSLAINASGELFAFGSNAHGRTGLGTDAGSTTTPTRVGTESNWTQVSAGGGHSLAINASGELFAFGSNGNDRAGLGADVSGTTVPTRVGTDSGWVQVGAGDTHSLALRTPVPEAAFTKTLQAPEGTTIPDPMSFDFSFTAVQQQISDDPVRHSIPVSDVPTIPSQTITLDMTTLSTVAGTTTVTGDLDLWALINGLTLSSGGIYVWELREIEGSSDTDSPLYVTYSEARFQIRAHADRYGNLFAIEIFELNYSNGTWTVGEKVEVADFVNVLRALTDFEVTKYVTGNYANLNTLFDFTVTLTGHDLAPLPTTIAARIVDSAGNPFDPPRNVTITNGVGTFQLAHGERLEIASLPAGTTAVVTEAASPEFRASYRLFSGGDDAGSDQNTAPNTALTTDSVLIADTGRNAADFTNDHYHTPPTGLVITTAPWVALIAAALLLVLVGANRKRKSIEEMPVVW